MPDSSSLVYISCAGTLPIGRPQLPNASNVKYIYVSLNF